MKYRANSLLWVSLPIAVTLAACGVKPSEIRSVPGMIGTMSSSEARNATYRFAYAAQVLDAKTGEPIPNFSVSVPGTPNGNVINPLGDSNGMFFVSRPTSGGEAASALMKMLVAAPGYFPIVQGADVAADCTAVSCAGTKPVTILLQSLTSLLGKTGTTPSFDTKAVADALKTNGMTTLLSTLGTGGKIDPALLTALKGAKPTDVLSNILVVLNGTTAGATPTATLVQQLLASVPNGKLGSLGNLATLVPALLPMLAQSNPTTSGALVSVNQLLPYLAPLLQGIGTKPNGSALIAMLTSMLGGTTTPTTPTVPATNNLATILQGLLSGLSSGTGTGGGVSLAMTTLLPILMNVLKKPTTGTGSGTPTGMQTVVQGLLGVLLGNSTLANLIAGIKPGNTSGTPAGLQMLLTYLQPLIQALSSGQSASLATLFNSFVQQNGVSGLQNFQALLANNPNLGALAPFLEPVIRGLNSQDASQLAAALAPILSQNNPAAAIRGLLTKGMTSTNPNLQALVKTLFPALQSTLTQTVPGKQVFAAQLLQGLLNGNFNGLSVVQDMSGGPGLVVAGTVADILKVAALPNVGKVVALQP